MNIRLKTGWPMPLRLILAILILVGLDLPAAETAPTSAATMLVYFGTYTGPASKGIYVSDFDPATGRLSAPRVAAEVISPAFLALHPGRDLLYAVNEVQSLNDQPGGGVSAFSIHAETGKLTLLNQESTRGAGPCHLTVDAAGRGLFVANYGGGSITVLPIRQGGELEPATAFIQHSGSSVNASRQSAPHAHGIYLDPSNQFVFVPDLGIDKILIYHWDPATFALRPHDPPAVSLAPGAGPRHFVFHPDARFAYVINELLNTITAFTYDAPSGSLRQIQTISTLPDNFSGQSSTAEITVHPSGKFLYGSNRGHDSLVTYAIDPATGQLRLLGHTNTQGRTPRNFALDPSGRWLLVANQNSNNVVVFPIDPQSGLPGSANHTIEVPTPVCVLFR